MTFLHELLLESFHNDVLDVRKKLIDKFFSLLFQNYIIVCSQSLERAQYL